MEDETIVEDVVTNEEDSNDSTDYKALYEEEQTKAEQATADAEKWKGRFKKDKANTKDTK
jgi:hypothetical protein